jgi:FPC/CPF motif-containing protein YcgG
VSFFLKKSPKERNPYRSPIARANSNYLGVVDGTLRLLAARKPVSDRARVAHERLRAMLGDSRYPCAGARAALNTAYYRFGIYRGMAGPGASAGLAHDLWEFVAERPRMKTDFATFIAIFDEADAKSEKLFEKKFWNQLQALHDLDSDAYDPAVSSDPESSKFGFSFAGHAFFVIGMHPGSSRLARRFAYPAMVFNTHAQFDALEDKSLYDRFVAVVRGRDQALQGSLNPNLAGAGIRSEARQYAGRAVEERWKCPFRPCRGDRKTPRA